MAFYTKQDFSAISCPHPTLSTVGYFFFFISNDKIVLFFSESIDYALNRKIKGLGLYHATVALLFLRSCQPLLLIVSRFEGHEIEANSVIYIHIYLG